MAVRIRWTVLAGVCLLGAAAVGTRAAPQAQTPVEARLVDAGDGSSAAFARLGDRARGAIALVKSGPMESMVELVVEHMRDPGLLRAARKAQVAALLIQSTHAGNSVYRHLISLD